MSAPVLEQVFNRCHPQHKQHRKHGDLLAESVDRRHPVQQHDKYEIQIGHPVELFEEVAGQERQQRVFGGAYPVVRPFAVRVFFARRLRRHRVVRHHDPEPFLQVVFRFAAQQQTEEPAPHRQRRFAAQRVHTLGTRGLSATTK